MATKPAVVVCDSSVLFPIVLVNRFDLLRMIRDRYAIQPLIHEAVHAEIQRLLGKWHKDRVGAFQKCLRTGAVKTLDEESLSDAGFNPADAVIDQIDELGARFNALAVDRGEAYTHAAGNVLKVPTFSQDIRALQRLKEAGYYAERPILRLFDLLALAFQVGQLDGRECHKTVRALIDLGEAVPACFTNCGFEDGLRSYFPRLIDSVLDRVGLQEPPGHFDDRLIIAPK